MQEVGDWEREDAERARAGDPHDSAEEQSVWAVRKIHMPEMNNF